MSPKKSFKFAKLILTGELKNIFPKISNDSVTWNDLLKRSHNLSSNLVKAIPFTKRQSPTRGLIFSSSYLCRFAAEKLPLESNCCSWVNVFDPRWRPEIVLGWPYLGFGHEASRDPSPFLAIAPPLSFRGSNFASYQDRVVISLDGQKRWIWVELVATTTRKEETLMRQYSRHTPLLYPGWFSPSNPVLMSHSQ